MTLYALTRVAEVTAAYTRLAGHFAKGAGTECEVLERSVGFKGGSEQVSVRWYASLGYWAMLDPKRAETRYWCAFGVENPNEHDELVITCEINPPHQGIDRTCAGLFVRSNNGTVYLAHSGGIGGGRPGVGRTRFLEFFGSEKLDDVTWPDGRISEYVIIAALDDDELIMQVGDFVHKVAEFKTLCKK